MQRSHAGAGCDLVGVARACGIANAHEAETLEQVAELRKSVAESDRTLFARVLIEADDPPRVMPSRDAVEIKLRMRRALGVAA